MINVAPEGSQPSLMDATEDMRAFHPALAKGGERQINGGGVLRRAPLCS